MDVHVVIGANYGDEGKGTMVQRLTDPKKKTLVIMTNGGAQRGHTIVSPTGERFVNKHFHSGFLNGADCLFAKSFILNPMEFKTEYEKNQSHLYDESGYRKVAFYRDTNCRWTTPWDMLANQVDSEASEIFHSCGMGIWETIKRDNDPLLAIKLDDFLSMEHDRKIAYLELLRKTKLKEAAFARNSKYYDIFTDEDMVRGINEHFIQDCIFLQMMTTAFDVDTIIKEKVEGKTDYSFLDSYDRIIFENGQGLAIGSQSKRETPDGAEQTPTDTGLLGATNDFVFWLKTFDSIDVHYVSRTYATRHGVGRIDGKEYDDTNFISSGIKEDLTNHFNEFQGGFRYGTINSFLLQSRILKDVKDSPDLIRPKVKKILDFTHCDERGAEDIIVSGMDQINYYGDVR